MPAPELNLELDRDWLDEHNATDLQDRILAVLKGKGDGSDFLTRLVETSLGRVSYLMGKQVCAEIIGLDRADTKEIFARAGRIFVGEGALRELLNESLRLSSWLTDVFIANYGNLLGSLPPLATMCPVGAFPGLALRCRSSPHDDHYGNRWHRYNVAVRQARRLERGDAIDLTERGGFHYDFARLTTFGLSEAIENALRWSTGTHVTRLAVRLSLGAVIFSLSHEFQHVRLGHGEHRGGSDAHAFEHEADVQALRAMLTHGSGLDIYAGLQVFRAVHERSRPQHRGASSHPSSPLRLQVLSDAMQREVGGSVLRAELDDLRNDLDEELIQMVPADPAAKWERAWLTTAQDSRGCMVRLRVGVDVTGEAMTPNEVERLAMPVILELRPTGEGSGSVRAVVQKMPYATTQLGTPKSIHTYQLHLPVPPVWRRNGGISAVSAGALTAPFAGPHEMADYDTSVLSEAARMRNNESDLLWLSEWPLVDDEALDHLVARPWDESQVLDLADAVNWCFGSGHKDAAERLLGVMAERDFGAGGDFLFHGLLALLWDRGDLTGATALVERFLAEWGKPNPGYFLGLARLALRTHAYVEAFDHAFAERFVFGCYGPEFETAGALATAAIDVGRQAGGAQARVMRGIRAFQEAYGDAADALHGRTTKLLGVLRILEELSTDIGDRLCWRQFHAEVLADLGVDGDRAALERARDEFEALHTRWPWFVAALAQEARVVAELGHTDYAAELLRKCDDIAPLHDQVIGGWRTIFHEVPILDPLTLSVPNPGFTGTYLEETDFWEWKHVPAPAEQEDES